MKTRRSAIMPKSLILAVLLGLGFGATAPAALASGSAAPSDQAVIEGIHAEYQNNPGTDITAIREKAKTQYGITDEQLDRVIPNLWSDDTAETWVRDRINTGLTQEQIREEAKRVYGGTDAQLDRITGRIAGPTQDTSTAAITPAMTSDPTGAASSSGLTSECNTFCNSPGGAGDALCAQAQMIANSATNRGATGLMTNSRNQTTAATHTADAIARRNAQTQAAQASALSRVTRDVQRASERR